jgi:hypothetical protein
MIGCFSLEPDGPPTIEATRQMKKITLLWREAETTGEWELRLSTDPSGAPAPAHAASGAAGRINKSMISVGAIERSLKTPELMQACTASRRTKASMSVLNSARYSALCAQGRVPARDQSPLAARPRSWSPGTTREFNPTARKGVLWDTFKSTMVQCSPPRVRA